MIFSDILQPTHLLLILAAALLVPGPKRLPEAARGIGRSIHQVKAAINIGPPPDRVTAAPKPPQRTA